MQPIGRVNHSRSKYNCVVRTQYPGVNKGEEEALTRAQPEMTAEIECGPCVRTKVAGLMASVQWNSLGVPPRIRKWTKYLSQQPCLGRKQPRDHGTPYWTLYNLWINKTPLSLLEE